MDVIDSDDLDPKFSFEEYTAEVVSGASTGTLRVKPEKIRAEDRDTLRSPVEYSLKSGKPNDYLFYFEINQATGVIKQKNKIDKKLNNGNENYEIMVEATEKTPKRRKTTTKLKIRVLAEDKNPPVLAVSAVDGYVDEHSAVGTFVTDINGDRISFNISDDDLNNVTLSDYHFEMTSNSFQVDSDGFLIVKDPNLDRDPPFEPTLDFQIFVREISGGKKASAPIGLTIYQRDINDNAPILSSISDITIIAGNKRRIIGTVNIIYIF